MKAQEMRTMSVEELKELLTQLQRNLFDHHTKARTKELKNTSQIQAIRRDLARAKTILNEKGEKV